MRGCESARDERKRARDNGRTEPDTLHKTASSLRRAVHSHGRRGRCAGHGEEAELVSGNKRRTFVPRPGVE